MLKARTDQYPSHLLDGNPVSCLALLEKSVIVLHSVFMSFDGLCHMWIFMSHLTIPAASSFPCRNPAIQQFL